MDLQLLNPDAEKSVLALSDSDLLLQVIEINLDHPVQAVSLACGETVPCATNFDLVIIALSGPTEEPTRTLDYPGIDSQLGRVPVLIICHQPVAPHPEKAIHYLPFPFDAVALRRKVRMLLK
jgi:hypothetical protein